MLLWMLVITLTMPNGTMKTSNEYTKDEAQCQRHLKHRALGLTRAVENNIIKDFALECKPADKPITETE